MRTLLSAFLFGLCLPVFGQPAQTAPPATPGDTAYLPGLPEFVSGGMIQNALWSPDGRYVLAVRTHLVLSGLEPSEMTTEVSVYSAATHKSSVVLTERNPAASVTSVNWLPGTSVAFLGVRINSGEGGPNAAVWRVDARRASAAVIAGIEDEEAPMVSPSKSIAFVWRPVNGAIRVRSLSSAGALGAPVEVPGTGGPTGWRADGARVYVYVRSVPPANGPISLALDPLTGLTEKVAQMDPYVPAQPRAPFRLESSGKSDHVSNDPFGRTAPTPLMLTQASKSFPSLMIAADADNYSLSPRRDAVLYTNLEGAFVIPINGVSESVLTAARTKAQQAHLMSNGKQIALALFMYASDHDDIFPGSQEDLHAILKPYTKDEAIFEGIDGNKASFRYLYQGGPMKDITDPANTVIGTIDGPGGQALIFADGHVQWKNQ